MKKTLLLLSSAALLMSCNNNSTKTTVNGFEYEITVDETGENIEPGSVVVFDAQIHVVNSATGKDSLVADTKEMSDTPQKFPIPARKDLDENKIKEPLIDLLLLMSKGDKGYVAQKFDTIPELKGQFPDYDKLRFTVSVLDVLTKEQFEAEMDAANEIENQKMAEVRERETAVADLVSEKLVQYKQKQLADLKQIDGGTEILVIEDGTGEMFTPGDVASVHYYGVLKSTGTMFDNSFKRGQIFRFQVGVGQVIPGWDSGLMQLKKGTKAVLFIPSSQGYGESGSGPLIGPNEDLVFYVELED